MLNYLENNKVLDQSTLSEYSIITEQKKIQYALTIHKVQNRTLPTTAFVYVNVEKHI